jgi:pyrroline-5-carboxylate reductase
MRVGLIGCGRMAGAMAARWLASGHLDVTQLAACTAHEASAREVRQRLGIACGTDAAAVVAAADVVLLGCKPQQVDAVLAVAGACARPGQVWLSILAGTPTARIEAGLTQGAVVVRAMPNTPSRIGHGLVALAGGRSAAAGDVQRVTNLLAPLGRVVELSEDRFDAFTAVAGSGPAYVFAFLDALEQAAVAQGFDAATARELALRVAGGAVRLAETDPRPARELEAEVVSKGGTTAAALGVLAAADWRAAMVHAVAAAQARGREMAAQSSGGTA